MLDSSVLQKPGELNIVNLHSNLHLPKQCKLAEEPQLQFCTMRGARGLDFSSLMFKGPHGVGSGQRSLERW